ncbi:MAG: HEAT repeat domain-containing protein [Pirellulales bacterium]
MTVVWRAGRLCRAAVAFALWAGALGGPLAGRGRADVFVLQSAGEVRGELVNRDESPRKAYVIKTASGGLVTLEADQVKEVRRQSPVEMKYDQILPKCPDTVDGHWKLAEWCRENRLTKERKIQLERIIELDPNHADARHGLGYSQIGGRWVTQEQLMIENGYVRSKIAPGKWVLPQEETLLEQQNKSTKAQLEWNAKLKRFSNWLGTEKGPQAVAGIKAIDDPFAVGALAKYLQADSRRDARLLYVLALSRINSPAAMEVLVGVSLSDHDEEIRLATLDQVVSHNYKPAVARYVKALKHKDNLVVNLAAVGLREMKDASAIGPLIDALVTTHTFRIQTGQPGQTTTTFGTGPNSGGFSMGGSKVEIIKRQFENRAVLQALVDLTGGVSYNFDVKAWKYWYVAQKKPKTLDARRDSTQ